MADCYYLNVYTIDIIGLISADERRKTFKMPQSAMASANSVDQVFVECLQHSTKFDP